MSSICWRERISLLDVNKWHGYIHTGPREGKDDCFTFFDRNVSIDLTNQFENMFLKQMNRNEIGIAKIQMKLICWRERISLLNVKQWHAHMNICTSERKDHYFTFFDWNSSNDLTNQLEKKSSSFMLCRCLTIRG